MNIDEIKFLNVREVWQQSLQWLQRKEPFLHIRIGDGEWKSMFYVGETRKKITRCDSYSKEISDVVFLTVEELLQSIAQNPNQNIIIGSDWTGVGNLPIGRRFYVYVKTKPEAVFHAKWATGDVWYVSVDETSGKQVDDKGTLALLAELRTRKKPVVLVCSKGIADARWCLNAQRVVLVPEANASEERERILKECEEDIEPGTVFVWSAGFATKVVSWQLWKKYPTSSHIDIGHFFNGVFGFYDRSWLDIKAQNHWGYLQKILKPYVLGFIP